MKERKLSNAAIALLRTAVQRAKDNYTGLDMGVWVQGAADRYSELISTGHMEDAPPPPDCGTVGCLAFEILAAKGEPVHELLGNMCNLQTAASRALGVTSIDTQYLFLGPDMWPIDLRRAYEATQRFTPERAEVLGQAVERWIAGDGSFSFGQLIVK